MTTPPQPRYIDPCRETTCNNHGSCVVPTGGVEKECECDLGYKGVFCEDTVNGALSVPLTLSVFAVLIGLVVLAFVVAKFRQRQKRRRKLLAEKHVYNSDA